MNLCQNARIGVAMFVALAVFPLASKAQDKETKDDKKTEQRPPEAVPKEEIAVTEHSIQLKGKAIPYRATVGSILLKNDKDEPVALLYYTAYTRSDVTNPAERPLSFSYNGGPGSSSIYVHMGAFGPRRVLAPDAAPATPPPYQITDNANSLVDATDLVFIDPIGTGYSHAVGKAQNKDFWGVDEDVRSLAQFACAYVSRNNRWNSPKYLIGESYGTYRSAALSNYLQSNNGMYFNGIVLISSIMNMGWTHSVIPGQDLPYELYLPSYAAAAWYHKVLQDRPEDLNAFLEQARQFAKTEYAIALMKGDHLTAAEKADMAKKLSRYTGLSEEYLLRANLRVTLSQFREELQRSRGLTTGRLDGRYSGTTYDLLGENATYDPLTTATDGAFTAALNNYMHNELKFGQDKTYHTRAEFGSNSWDWKHAGDSNGPFGQPNVEHDLAEALITNPRLQIETENGLFDLATPFFATEYTMGHLGLPESLQKNIHFQYYESGHVIYLHDEAQAKLSKNIEAFIERTEKP